MPKSDDVLTKNESLGSAAMRGSILNSAQWLINKAFTAGAMFVIAYCLTPAEYGVGVQALAILGITAFCGCVCAVNIFEACAPHWTRR